MIATFNILSTTGEIAVRTMRWCVTESASGIQTVPELINWVADNDVALIVSETQKKVNKKKDAFIESIQSTLDVLRALIEQVDRLAKQYNKMLIMANWRLKAVVLCLYQDLCVHMNAVHRKVIIWGALTALDTS